MHFDRTFSGYLKFLPDSKYEQLFDNLYVNEWTSEEVLKPVRGVCSAMRTRQQITL